MIVQDTPNLIALGLLIGSASSMFLIAGRWAGATLAARLVQYAQRRLQGR